jgi:hypothetical protein
MSQTREVVYADTDRGLLVLPEREAERLAAIHDAIWSSASCGELRARLLAADPTIDKLKDRLDDQPVDPATLGLEDGSWPGLPEGLLLTWFPELTGEPGLARFLHHRHLMYADELEASIIESWDELRTYPNERFDDEYEPDEGTEGLASLPDDPLEVFRTAGYILREDKELVARAAGFNPSGETLIPRAFPNRWSLADRGISYNMVSSDSQSLYIEWCGGDKWAVTRSPRSWDDSVFELIQDGGEAEWTWLGSGCLEPEELLEEVTGTRGLAESPYGYSEPGEFVDDLLHHTEGRLRELGRVMSEIDT